MDAPTRRHACWILAAALVAGSVHAGAPEDFAAGRAMARLARHGLRLATTTLQVRGEPPPAAMVTGGVRG